MAVHIGLFQGTIPARSAEKQCALLCAHFLLRSLGLQCPGHARGFACTCIILMSLHVVLSTFLPASVLYQAMIAIFGEWAQELVTGYVDKLDLFAISMAACSYLILCKST